MNLMKLLHNDHTVNVLNFTNVAMIVNILLDFIKWQTKIDVSAEYIHSQWIYLQHSYKIY